MGTNREPDAQKRALTDIVAYICALAFIIAVWSIPVARQQIVSRLKRYTGDEAVVHLTSDTSGEALTRSSTEQSPDSGTLRQGAAISEIYRSLFDCLIVVALLGVITVIRHFVSKKRNPSPSSAWYIPKIAGMLFFLIFGSVHFVTEGAYVEKVSNNPFWFIVMLAAALSTLYWAYCVVWKPIAPKSAD